MEYCDTLHPSRYRLYFSDNVVKPGTDSFLLADFIHPKKGMRVCDLGAGIGLLGLLLLNRCPELSCAALNCKRRLWPWPGAISRKMAYRKK